MALPEASGGGDTWLVSVSPLGMTGGGGRTLGIFFFFVPAEVGRTQLKTENKVVKIDQITYEASTLLES